MDPEHVRALLERVATGDVSVSQAQATLGAAELSLGGAQVATLDLQRAARVGIPEVVFGQGKSAEQLVTIVGALVDAGQDALVTRASPAKLDALTAAFPDGTAHPVARVFERRATEWIDRGRGEVLVICAGTSDLPVADEAAVVAHAFGNRVRRITDVGVAGLHRLLRHHDALREARVLVVVAGMEGALPSVVAGLTDRPILAVPTSVGYGAAFGGLAALLAMLNSCAAGVSVVNIDNGFGAAYQATQINRLP